MSNRNKQIVGYLYPRFRYVQGKTQYEFGQSIGSLNRKMLGVTRVLSNRVAVGYQVEYCPLRPRIGHTFSVKTSLNQTSTLTTSLITNTVRFGEKEQRLMSDTKLKLHYKKYFS